MKEDKTYRLVIGGLDFGEFKSSNESIVSKSKCCGHAIHETERGLRFCSQCLKDIEKD